MTLRSTAGTAVKKVLARKGLTVVCLDDASKCRWLAEESVVVPLPAMGVGDEVARLRPLRVSDAAAVSAGATDPDVIHFAVWPCPFTEEQARRWIVKSEAGRRAGQYFALAVEEAESGAFAGIIGLNHIDHYALTAEQFLWLVPGSRRKGLGNHATLLLDHWVFENSPISRLVAVAIVENEPARRQLPTIGYVEEGVLRGGVVHYGERHDAVQFSILRSDLAPGLPEVPDPRTAAFASCE